MDAFNALTDYEVGTKVPQAFAAMSSLLCSQGNPLKPHRCSTHEIPGLGASRRDNDLRPAPAGHFNITLSSAVPVAWIYGSYYCFCPVMAATRALRFHATKCRSSSTEVRIYTVIYARCTLSHNKLALMLTHCSELPGVLQRWRPAQRVSHVAKRNKSTV